jgi:hypothetical protein
MCVVASLYRAAAGGRGGFGGRGGGRGGFGGGRGGGGFGGRGEPSVGRAAGLVGLGRVHHSMLLQ